MSKSYNIARIIEQLKEIIDTDKAPRAFENKDYKYYILQKDMPILNKGAVFYHDRQDTYRGVLGRDV